MKSRMEKYNNLGTGNRTDRNKNLYKELNKTDLSITRTYSNSRVIDEANKEIDIEKIKRYIEKMNDGGTVSRTRIDDIEITTTMISEEEPEKDYDLNSVLEKARSKREIDYEQERSRKVNYSYDDILSQIEKYNKETLIEEDDEELNTEEQTLVNLINTISMNKKEAEEADLFEDLKGSENTQVLGNINEMSEDESFKGEIKKQLNTDFSTKELMEIREQVNEVLENTKELSKTSNSFYTTSDVFSAKDFQENLSDDEDDEDEKVSPIKVVGIAIIAILLIVILVVIANFVFELGLF